MANKRTQYSRQFKAEVAKLVIDGGKKVTEVSKEHNLDEGLVYGWVRQARIDEGDTPRGAQTSSERAEHSRLRKANKELEKENTFLKKIAAFFAAMKA